MTTVWIDSRRNVPGERLSSEVYVCEWYAHAIELRRRNFYSYREAQQFARRKAGKGGCIFDNTPEQLRA
jgi:hypothetical protein